MGETSGEVDSSTCVLFPYNHLIPISAYRTHVKHMLLSKDNIAAPPAALKASAQASRLLNVV